jgi:carboxypeptidase C (cathepsin A)
MKKAAENRPLSLLSAAVAASALLFAALPALADDPKAEPKDKPAIEKKSEIGPERQSVTQHTLNLGGREIRYTATAGTVILREEDGTPKASVFYIAYTMDGVKDPAQRPLTFSFNGGPGSSSVWLHLGVLGPRRVLMDDEGRQLPPPYRLVDNEASVLDLTDLVFIDPVSTGYSRAVPGEDPKQFHGLDEDIKAVGDFIRLYTVRQARWSSPKFLIGESYGTTRAAGLSGYLQNNHGYYMNGIMLVSSILNFQTARFDVGNDLPYPLFLPTYTATAWYHKQLPAELQERPLREVLDEAEQFALGDYWSALAQGSRLDAAGRGRIAAKLSRLTGLSEEWIERANLRIDIHRFTKELMRPERRTVGRLDSRFIGIDDDQNGTEFEHDPSMTAIMGPYTATINDYLRRELEFSSDLSYEILTGKVRPWKFEGGRYADTAGVLREAMTKNPSLKVYVANGYYDLATPYFATHYTFDHLGLDPSLMGNVSMHYYEAGHMMYIQKQSLLQQKKDLAAFYASAIPKAK